MKEREDREEAYASCKRMLTTHSRTKTFRSPHRSFSPYTGIAVLLTTPFSLCSPYTYTPARQ